MHLLDRIRQSRELLVLTALLALVSGYTLLHLAHILTPFVVAAVFAYLVHPLVDWAESRTHLPRVVVVLALYALLGTALVVGGMLIVPSLGQQLHALVRIVPEVIEAIDRRLASTPELRIGELVIDTRALVFQLDTAAQSLTERFSQEAVPLVLATVEALIKSLVFPLSASMVSSRGAHWSHGCVHWLRVVTNERSVAFSVRLTQPSVPTSAPSLCCSSSWPQPPISPSPSCR